MPSPKHQPTVPAVPSFSPKLLPKSLPQVAKKPVPGKKQAALAQSKEKVKGGKGKQDVTSAGDLSHASITVLSEKKLFLGQKLTVIQGDLSGVTADAAIHPTNASFSLSGEVGQALEKVGGKEFIQEVKELLAAHGPLESTGAAICPGHHFPAKFVLHCNIPSWSTVNANDSLETSVRNCLSLADEKNIKVLAVPPLVTHSAPSQKQQAAQVILKAISNYFVNVMSSSLKQIYFVLSDMESIGIYTSELAKLDS